MHAVRARVRLSAAPCRLAVTGRRGSRYSTSLCLGAAPSTRIKRYHRPRIQTPASCTGRRLVSNNPKGSTGDGSGPDKPGGREGEEEDKKDEDSQSSNNSENKKSELEERGAIQRREVDLGGPLFTITNRISRSASSRSNDGLPPVDLPRWFLDEDVCTFDPASAAAERAANLERLETRHSVAISPAHVESPAQDGSEAKPSEDAAVEEQDHRPDDAVQSVPAAGKVNEAPISTPPKRTDLVSEVTQTSGDTPKAGTPPSWTVDPPCSQQAVSQELLATVSAELSAVPPPGNGRSAKDAKRRPVTILSVSNYRGCRVARNVVGNVAIDLGADVIHLDAAKIARIVGPYLGQTSYYGRGQISTLGYKVAEANGRLLPGAVPEHEEPEGVNLSLHKLFQPTSDEWEDLKLNHIFREIVRAANSKRKLSKPTDSLTPLILHIHDFLELTMVSSGTALMNKIRAVVDQWWLKGKKVIILGSTSNDKTPPQKWLDSLHDLNKDDYYLIPYNIGVAQATEAAAWQRSDFFQDNLRNLSWMMESMTAQTVCLELPDYLSRLDQDEILKRLRQSFSAYIWPLQWIYRFATLILGRTRARSHLPDTAAVVDAYKQMNQVDDIRNTSALPSERPFPGVAFPTKPDYQARNKNTADRRKPAIDTRDLDDEEKKLLSGLVNVDEIKTTFDEVIAPPETRESLMSLTTLSLQHPSAFRYGVLARERIHGCLLYGPPGTGKTLMAKAVAKESGANMLEISAASINDMWVGNSEKNVRAVFSLARKLSPMVVFLDEAEALLGARGRQPNRGGYRETINQFLREWDGLTDSLDDTNTFIMIATNRPFDLDEAVLRRLPRRILVDLPLRDARLAILRSLLRDEALDPSVDLEKIADETELYSGSDLKNVCVAAAMEAAKEELRAMKAHSGPPSEFHFPARRMLTKAHFDKASRDISASISEDMESLKAIRKFDERYGDSRRKKRRSLLGFEVVPNVQKSEEARVRLA